MARREFVVPDAPVYDQSHPIRWILSHLLRYKRWVAGFLLGTILSVLLYGGLPLLVGAAFGEILSPAPDRGRLLTIALAMTALVVSQAGFSLLGRFSAEVLGKRFKRDARAELFASLLGKSQTFHNRQRVGDLMARSANDVGQLSNMIVPGVDTIVDSFASGLAALVYIGLLKPALLLVPLVFTMAFLLALRDYSRRLAPVSGGMREQFGRVNAGLNEAIAGIEVVKATAQEEREKRKFADAIRRYRDFFVRNGEVQARYLPPLFLALATVAGFLHGVYLVSQGALTIGGLIAYVGLLNVLGYPAFMPIWALSIIQLGYASSRRILELMGEETELDENARGHVGTVRGEIVFEHVSFGYGDTLVLDDVTFRVAPGQTVAIVGRTGAGKSTLTKLINRIYDTSGGRVLVDGIDVRDWQIASLRGQVSTIEQDVFLFARSIGENIAFGLGQKAMPEAIEQAAKDAQAHGFIASFPDGYATVIGERGVTLSGGQRQRLAIARALLTDPRILILDDSTSAIDSATEDEIQKAIRRLLQRRTTFLITHRLSQIRWADLILILDDGRLLDQGTHHELLARCEPYHRLFTRYDVATPTLTGVS